MRESQFESMINKGLLEGGVHVNASKGHGKTRLLFSIAENLRKRQDCRTLIFDGSDAWFFGFSEIPVFEVGESDIQLLSKIKKTDDVERYRLNNWEAVTLTLSQNKDLLFRLKSRKPSKRGFFVRQVINYIDRLQRAEREQSPNYEPSQFYAFFVEEAQDAFNSRSTTRLEAEEFLTVFNEGRNQKEAFFTASQRLTDFSKTIRSKQKYCLGNIALEDRDTAIRGIEKAYKTNFSKMSLRNWFFEGEKFESPTWTQQKKPFTINPPSLEVVKEAPKGVKAMNKRQNKPIQQPNVLKQLLYGFMGLFTFICAFLGVTGLVIAVAIDLLIFGFYRLIEKGSFPAQAVHSNYVMEMPTVEENIQEDSEGDALMTLPEDESLFPPEA